MRLKRRKAAPAAKQGEKKKMTARQRRKVKNILSGKHNRFYDFSLLAVVIFLCFFGLLMVFSSSAYSAMTDVKLQDMFYFFRKQGVIMLGSMVLVLLVSNFCDYHWLKFPLIIWAALLASIALMLLVNYTPLGVEINGQRRWLGYGNHTFFQAAEPVKIGLIVWVAGMVDRHYDRMDGFWAPVLIGFSFLVPTVLVLDKNLSSGIILFGMLFGMLFIASKKNWMYAAAFAAIAVILYIAITKTDYLVAHHFLKSYQASRIYVWKDPANPAYRQEGGYQVVQGLYAIGSGGWFGKGFGQGTQKLSSVPEASNDMIFSIICEELGVLGAICVIALFVFLLWRCMQIAMNAKDMFGSMLVVGFMLQIGLQVMMNIAVVTNSMPNTGVTLPFISYGGTSMLFLLFEVAIVLNVSNQITVTR